MAATQTGNARVTYVCKHLRTKSLYIPADERGASVLVEPSETAHYWCNRTGAETGPDNDFAGPRECRAERTCYVAMPVVIRFPATE
jgi:hypothetical protein